MKFGFSITRLWAIMVKEFLQMCRDPVTFGMIVSIPLLQLLLFGYAINIDPKNLPVAVVLADNSTFTRTFLETMQNTRYFSFTKTLTNEQQAQHMLATGKVQFVVSIPPNFSQDVIRGLQPSILIQADATDPAATGNAIAALHILAQSALNPELKGSLAYLHPQPPPFNIRLHAMYNPHSITQYNIVPGLLGVVLTMSMTIITALTITRELERGTMESLLAMPVNSVEVIFGKLIPYIAVGYIQVAMILAASTFLFHIPIHGSLTLLLITCLPFIIANLAVGITFSTVANNQLQAAQATMFFFLPSILLSGFMFPFRGMPEWAQWVGDMLPLTHFVNIVKGILLKGNTFNEIWPSVWPILVFTVVVIIIALVRYRQTLD